MRAARPGFGNLGTLASGTTSCTPSYPTGISAATSRLYCMVGSGGDTEPTPTMPDGWTQIGTLSGGGGVYGENVGPRRVTFFKKDVVTGSETGTVTVSLSGGDVVAARIFRVEIPSGYSIDEQFVSGSDDTLGTGFSVTATSDVEFDPFRLVVFGSVLNNDAASYIIYTPVVTVTGGTLTSPEWFPTAVTTGNDLRHTLHHTSVSAGSGTGTLAISSTLAANASGPVGFLVLRATTTVTFDQEGYRFGADDGAEAAHTWLADSDTNIVRPIGTRFLLRTLIDTGGGPVGPTAFPFALYYEKNGSGGYQPVPVGPGTPSTAFLGTTGVGTTSCTPRYPSSISAATSRLYCMVGSGGDTEPTPTMPDGWTQIGTLSGGGGVYGENVGPRRVTFFKKDVVTGSETGTVTVSLSGGDVVAARIFRVETRPGSIIREQFASGAETTYDTSWSVTGTPTVDLDDSCRVLVGTIQSTDTATQSGRAITASGITFGTIGNRTSIASNTGNDLRFVLDSVAVAAGGGSGNVALTWSHTNSANTSGVTAFLVLSAPSALYVDASPNITTGGEATTARLTPPSGKTEDDFTTGRRWDDENGDAFDSVSINANGYTELEWALNTASPLLVGGDYFDFRVYANTDANTALSALDTYSVTPRLTLPSLILVSPNDIAVTAPTAGLITNPTIPVAAAPITVSAPPREIFATFITDALLSAVIEANSWGSLDPNDPYYQANLDTVIDDLLNIYVPRVGRYAQLTIPFSAQAVTVSVADATIVPLGRTLDVAANEIDTSAPTSTPRSRINIAADTNTTIVTAPAVSIRASITVLCDTNTLNVTAPALNEGTVVSVTENIVTVLAGEVASSSPVFLPQDGNVVAVTAPETVVRSTVMVSQDVGAIDIIAPISSRRPVTTQAATENIVTVLAGEVASSSPVFLPQDGNVMAVTAPEATIRVTVAATTSTNTLNVTAPSISGGIVVRVIENMVTVLAGEVASSSPVFLPQDGNVVAVTAPEATIRATQNALVGDNSIAVTTSAVATFAVIRITASTPDLAAASPDITYSTVRTTTSDVGTITLSPSPVDIALSPISRSVDMQVVDVSATPATAVVGGVQYLDDGNNIDVSGSVVVAQTTTAATVDTTAVMIDTGFVTVMTIAERPAVTALVAVEAPDITRRAIFLRQVAPLFIVGSAPIPLLTAGASVHSLDTGLLQSAAPPVSRDAAVIGITDTSNVAITAPQVGIFRRTDVTVNAATIDTSANAVLVALGGVTVVSAPAVYTAAANIPTIVRERLAVVDPVSIELFAPEAGIPTILKVQQAPILTMTAVTGVARGQTSVSVSVSECSIQVPGVRIVLTILPTVAVTIQMSAASPRIHATRPDIFAAASWVVPLQGTVWYVDTVFY